MSKCNHCEHEGTCYAHCQEKADGKHEPDPRTASTFYENGLDSEYVYVDFNCKHCGTSGSTKVNLNDVVFS